MLHFLTDHPNSARAVVLVGTGAFTPENYVESERRAVSLAGTRIGRFLLPYLVTRDTMKRSVAQYFGKKEAIRPELIDRFYALSRYRPNRGAPFTLVSNAFEDYNEVSNLDRISVPVLLLWGDLDRTSSLTMGERLRAELPDADLVVFPGVGHMVMEEAPAESGSTARDFLVGVLDGKR